MRAFLILALAAVLANAAPGPAQAPAVDPQFRCPAKDGQYEDEYQCDKFYECVEGVATAKLCQDGLVFDESIRKINKCDQIFNVDCGQRTELQPPQGNEYCPRKNGFFSHPDPTVCSLFYNCIEGQFTVVPCSPGLHFDESKGTCDWPHSVNKTECHPPHTKLSDGFECPQNWVHDNLGQAVTHPRFAHPTDCQKFYVCLSGVDPRLLACAPGEAYNEDSMTCDAPENVPGCEDWYKSDDEDEPPKSAPNPPPKQQQQQQAPPKRN